MQSEKFEAEWALLDMCSDFALIVEPETGEILRSNRAFRQWFEIAAHDPLPRSIDELSPQLTVGTEFQRPSELDEKFTAEKECPLHLRGRENQAQRCRIRLKLLRQPTPSNECAPVLAVVIQNPLHSPEAAQSESATRDPVTGLPNREVLMKRLEKLIQGERCADQDFTLLFIDLDDFKPINDRWGHVVGDEVLGEVGRRLARCIRHGDLLVRYGGDEFVALIEQASLECEYQPVIERLERALDVPIVTSAGISANVSASVGAIDSRHFDGTAWDFLDAADQAMYRSKRQRVTADSPNRGR